MVQQLEQNQKNNINCSNPGRRLPPGWKQKDFEDYQFCMKELDKILKEQRKKRLLNNANIR